MGIEFDLMEMRCYSPDDEFMALIKEDNMQGCESFNMIFGTQYNCESSHMMFATEYNCESSCVLCDFKYYQEGSLVYDVYGDEIGPDGEYLFDSNGAIPLNHPIYDLYREAKENTDTTFTKSINVQDNQRLCFGISESNCTPRIR